ncbi:hypothetical protein PC113_g18262 [Phytophthora cactorum]|uniref:Uncharacterized protein n=1 Tax=Phytophthora cactorum TaxID=29920 RepID=A0A8T0YMW8_9STRA|nr:hypothetical protein PC113_g18262 [Phytophthora cactorum]
MKVKSWPGTLSLHGVSGSPDFTLRRHLSCGESYDGYLCKGVDGLAMNKQSGLNQVSAQRDRLRGNNDYLFRELSLAIPEIEELQSCVRDLERDPPRLPPLAVLLTQACDACATYSDFTQGEIVIRKYVGSLHSGSAHGESSTPNQAIDQPDQAADQPDPSVPDRDQALAEVSRLTSELAVAQASLQTQLTTASSKITKIDHERDNTLTSWANAARAQTELEATIRILSGQLKPAQQSATTLQTRVSEIQGRFERLESKGNRSNRQRDEALRRLALVAATANKPIQVTGAPDLSASAHNAPPSSDQAGSSSLRAGSTMDNPRPYPRCLVAVGTAPPDVAA